MFSKHYSRETAIEKISKLETSETFLKGDRCTRNLFSMTLTFHEDHDKQKNLT